MTTSNLHNINLVSPWEGKVGKTLVVLTKGSLFKSSYICLLNKDYCNYPLVLVNSYQPSPLKGTRDIGLVDNFKGHEARGLL